MSIGVGVQPTHNHTFAPAPVAVVGAGVQPKTMSIGV